MNFSKEKEFAKHEEDTEPMATDLTEGTLHDSTRDDEMDEEDVLKVPLKHDYKQYEAEVRRAKEEQEKRYFKSFVELQQVSNSSRTCSCRIFIVAFGLNCPNNFICKQSPRFVWNE